MAATVTSSLGLQQFCQQHCEPAKIFMYYIVSKLTESSFKAADTTQDLEYIK